MIRYTSRLVLHNPCPRTPQGQPVKNRKQPCNNILAWNVNTIQRWSIATSSIPYSQRMSDEGNCIGRRAIANKLVKYNTDVLMIIYLVITANLPKEQPVSRKGRPLEAVPSPINYASTVISVILMRNRLKGDMIADAKSISKETNLMLLVLLTCIPI